MPSSSGPDRFMSSVFSKAAKATGRSIKVVDVLEIHMLRKALAHIKPKTSRRGLVPPNARTMYSAIRRWAPLRSRAAAKMNPPSISSTKGLPYAAPSSFAVITPNKGKRAIGSSDVAGMGMGSNIHQITIQRVTAMVTAGANSPLFCDINKKAQIADAGPR